MSKSFSEKTIKTLAAFDAERYKSAMARFASAVHIVTTDGIAGVRGLTVSSCCSLSNDPPSLLCCIYDSENNLKFIQNDVFCVNSLSAEQSELASIFAGCTKVSNSERFHYGEWQKGVTGAPVLKNALMSIECELVGVQKYTTHHILFGQVRALQTGNAEDALIYLGRQFCNLPIKQG